MGCKSYAVLQHIYKGVYHRYTMTDKNINNKMVKFNLVAWKQLRRAFYGRKNETYSDYIQRVAIAIKTMKREDNDK